MCSGLQSYAVSLADNGLQTEDLQEGAGRAAMQNNVVVVHYVGTLEDGTLFDSSVTRGVPFEFQLGSGQVIQGWEQGIEGMREGGKRKLTIPPELAYGDRDLGIIPPSSTLIFEVELIEVKT